MPFIGNQPADKFLTLEKQVFTTSATDTYVLDREVSSVNDIELFLNNVRQEPTEAYTISGTTLTLASAITSSDSMYCIYQGRAVGTQSPAVGSVTNDMLAGSIATSKLADGSTFATTNGRQVLLSTQNPSGASSVEFIDGSGDIDFGTTYKYHIFEFENIFSSSSGDFLVFNASTDSGSNYNVSKSQVVLQSGSNAGSAFGLTVDGGQSFENGTGQATLVTGVDTSANTNEGIIGTFQVNQSGNTSYGKSYQGNFIYDASGAITVKLQIPYGLLQTTSAINAYKFNMNTGNITGTIRLYGVTA